MFRACRPALLVFVTFLVAVGCSGSVSGAPPLTAVRTAVAVPPELARFSGFLTELARRLKDGLVSVQARRATAGTSDATPRPPDRFRVGKGSGFVIDPSGIIVTAAHVVDGAESVSVRLADGRHFTTTVLGKDMRVDLAVLKIDGARLAALSLGDSDRVRPGEFVLALGHPFGLEQSVSLGIVSRKGPVLTGTLSAFDLIQTDAAVSPGDSGGALVNMAGEVVGVTSTAARNGALGLAIPANLVKALLPHLVRNGRMDWGWLGVSIAAVEDDDLKRLKLPEARGVVVTSIVPNEPADQAGLRADDVIVAVDGTRVDTPIDLQRVVSFTPVGKRIRVAVVRSGRASEVEVTIGLYTAPPPASGWGTHHSFS